MKTTLDIDDKMLEKAALLSGVKEKTKLVHMGLKALISNESSKKLAELGGIEKELTNIPRRRH